MNNFDAVRYQGHFMQYADGGYPLYYEDRDGSIVCADCATKNEESFPIVGYGVNYEDPDLYCDECSGPIASAYGEEEPTAPQDDDITTSNHRDFYQNGALILTVTDDQEWESEIKAYMDACEFWPDVWFISDHGNCHLLTID